MDRFKYWPFQISAGPLSGQHWADREKLKSDLDALVSNSKASRPSTLINIWAYFGAGKTYALRYMQQSAERSGLVGIYVVMPKGARGFIDVYRAIISAVPDECFLIVESYLKESRTAIGQSIYNACRMKSVGSPSQAATASAYLSAERTGVVARRDLGVTADLSDPNVAASALSMIFNAIASSRGMMLLLDEVQDLGGMNDRHLSETSGLLQKIFDEVQVGLRVIASFTTSVKETIRQVLGDAMFHRASRLIEIPEFSEDEAIGFIGDLLRLARTDETVDLFEPFGRERVLATICSIQDQGDKLVPRELVKCVGNLYETLGD